MKKALVIAALSLGTIVPLTGAAHAEPNGDPAAYADFTAEFVPVTSQAAFDAAKDGKHVIMSPHGTNRTIACRGNNADVAIYDCKQDDGWGWINLKTMDLPGVGKVWTTLS
ncbi:hypothetical protein ACFVMC_23840 [Nocardia sp. NPDC127579]|uniref:hypothetical protein n=1 Tax=Nocardia sp. NPDC127579 TaxID=3345402 RepID=UPI0036410039